MSEHFHAAVRALHATGCGTVIGPTEYAHLAGVQAHDEQLARTPDQKELACDAYAAAWVRSMKLIAPNHPSIANHEFMMTQIRKVSS